MQDRLDVLRDILQKRSFTNREIYGAFDLCLEEFSSLRDKLDSLGGDKEQVDKEQQGDKT